MNYYLPVPGTREYALVDVLPPGVRACDAFLAVEPYKVHAKPYGVVTKKPVEVTVYGASRDELLFQYDAPVTRYGVVTLTWDTCRFDQTTEGYRFVRSVVKVVKVLTAIGRKAAVERNKVERNRAAAKAREGREGTCQICEGRQILHPTGANKATLVLHGYSRPGYGYTVGQCFGYHRQPFEVACDALVEFVAMLGKKQASLETLLGKLPDQEEMTVNGERVTKSHPRWDAYLRRKVWEIDSEIRSVKEAITYQNARLAAWHEAHASKES